MTSQTPSSNAVLHDRIEARFEAWGHLVFRRRRTVLAAGLLMALAFAAGLPRLYVDVTFESFLGKSDAVRVGYEAFRERFGRDERIVVAVSAGSEAGPRGVFTPAFLDRLRELHDAIETRVPYVVEVTSLVNARDTHGEGDILFVDDFLDPWPEREADFAERRERALANPLFLNNVISEDGSVTTVMIEPELYSAAGREEDDLGGFDDKGAGIEDAGGDAWPDEPPPLLTGQETAEQIEALQAVVAEYDAPDFEVRAAGPPVMLHSVAESMSRDMPRFVALAVFSIATLLFVLFRRVVAVVLPIVVVALSVAATFGLMGWTGASMHIPTQILPSFLLAVGVGDAVHLLSIFFERLRAGEDREEALCHALGHSGLALVLTSLTTAGGLASFATAGIEPVARLGLFAPVGVMIALFLSLTMLPAAMAMAPLGKSRGLGDRNGPNRLDRLLAGSGRFAVEHRGSVVCVALLLTLAALASAATIRLSHDPLSWMDPESRIVEDTHFVDERLGGAMSFEILLETEAGGVRQPAVLDALASLGERLETEPRDGYRAGQTISLADVVKEINRALNANAPSAYTIPDDPRLIAQELLLFENSGTDDLEDLTDSQYDVARLTVRMPWADAVRYTPFFALARADTEAALGRFGQVSVTGVLALLVASITAVVTSMVESYVLAFAIIAPLMILLLADSRTGLIAMLPNALPIVLTLGLMGVTGYPLDAFSLMVGGIALGLAVDDTIHFMHNYRRYRRCGMKVEEAVETTLLTTGRAMLITSIVLSVGFLGFVLSSMVNLSNLGVLVAFAIGTALVADILLAPALLALIDRDE